MVLEKLIITAAICGAEVTKKQNPNVPYTVGEVAKEAELAYNAGASIIHLHVRYDDELPHRIKKGSESAHTVGIDAMINMKGYAGHYGLERYKMIDAHNLGSQVPNEEFIKRALELKADILLVSQTVT